MKRSQLRFGSCLILAALSMLPSSSHADGLDIILDKAGGILPWNWDNIEGETTTCEAETSIPEGSPFVGCGNSTGVYVIPGETMTFKTMSQGFDVTEQMCDDLGEITSDSDAECAEHCASLPKCPYMASNSVVDEEYVISMISSDKNGYTVQGFVVATLTCKCSATKPPPDVEGPPNGDGANTGGGAPTTGAGKEPSTGGNGSGPTTGGNGSGPTTGGGTGGPTTGATGIGKAKPEKGKTVDPGDPINPNPNGKPGKKKTKVTGSVTLPVPIPGIGTGRVKIGGTSYDG